MKAAVLNAPHDLTIEDRPMPMAGEGEALLSVRVAGICGSDVTAYVGTNPMVTYPRIPGHEVCAEVLDVPENGRGIASGDLVCAEPLLSCGRCAACRKGRYNCCMNLRVIGVHAEGAMCEQFTHRIDRLHKPRTVLTEEQLVLCEPLSIAMQACDRGEVDEDQRVVILGAGTIGLCALAIARTRTDQVLVVEKLPQRLERATALGAGATVNADEENVESAVSEWTNGEGADVVIEAVGSPATFAQTLELVAFGGRIVIVGWNKAPVTLERSHLLLQKEVDLVGSRNSREIFPRVMALVEAGMVDVTSLVTHRLPLDRARHGFELVVNESENVGKCLLTVG